MIRFVKRRRFPWWTRWRVNYHELLHGGVIASGYGLTRATFTCSCRTRFVGRTRARWRML